ncbi:sulfotransferase family protein [Ectothiorhodospira marina]|uniref:Sulfotransferase family protein n=1 Tax=Ectothiorhodospira marina TaxID=1396821 RepID=A0A1H7P4D0_9GAMM|nr:sulfotransferase [Ectothiorhodospira marina]SEL30662.1 Sulfotransferase family protein [Ectothiorhodospira marina]
MRVIIGYSMRSGSTLLAHILSGHSQARAYSDISSNWALARIALGLQPPGTVCIKPVDLLYLQRRLRLWERYDRCIWLARDPRDAYLSTVESGYAYLLWRRGRMEQGIDVGLLARWRRIYDSYLADPDPWYRVHYEDLVAEPDATLAGLLTYLDLPHEKLYPFQTFDIRHGGDYKIARSNTVRDDSRHRYRRELTAAQMEVFDRYLGPHMRALGYPLSDDIPHFVGKCEALHNPAPIQENVKYAQPIRHEAPIGSTCGMDE